MSVNFADATVSIMNKLATVTNGSYHSWRRPMAAKTRVTTLVFVQPCLPLRIELKTRVTTNVKSPNAARAVAELRIELSGVRMKFYSI
jgi:hypothetical protein